MSHASTDTVGRLWRHAAWADTALLGALRAAPDAVAPWREYAHLLSAEAVWLARLRGEPTQQPLWPVLDPAQAETLSDQLRAAYERYLAGLAPADMARRVPYTNSVGQAFENEIGDILLHVMLHGQYHRGKINLLLRQAGASPAPTDYIAYVRGAPAASTPR